MLKVMVSASWTYLVQVIDDVLGQKDVDDVLWQMFWYGSQSGNVISVQVERLAKSKMSTDRTGSRRQGH